MEVSLYPLYNTYYDKNNEINPVPQAMGVLNIIHDIRPTLQRDHLHTQDNNNYNHRQAKFAIREQEYDFCLYMLIR